MMKKRVYLKTGLIAASIATAGFALAVANTASAAISSGVCDSCHTMHNSQDGDSMNFDDSATANPALTRHTCMGCHTTDSAAKTHDESGAPLPILNSTTVPIYDAVETTGLNLPGGAFRLSHNLPATETNGVTNDSKWHNVADLNATEDSLLGGANPPGFTTTTANGVGSDWTTNQLTCGGTYGCHGDHSTIDGGAPAGSAAGIRGMHHKDGDSYRMLSGIVGGESADYNISDTFYSAGTQDGDDTISALCAQCHGDFHIATQSTSNWVRHPTENLLPSSGTMDDYDSYGTTPNNFHDEVPVGTTTYNATDGVSSATARVLCLSCHYAHGGDHADLLRWDYSTMDAGTEDTAAAGTGCFRCHTEKDGVTPTP